MAARVVSVDREAKRSWASRRLAPSGPLWAHAAGLVRALGRLLATPRTPFDPSPAARAPSGVASRRGLPVLVEEASGQPRCRPCPACTTICPANCIEVEVALVPPRGEADPALGTFRLDAGRCIGCGLCVEVCPERALFASDVVDVAAFEREDLRYEKEQLLVPVALLGERAAREPGPAS